MILCLVKYYHSCKISGNKSLLSGICPHSTSLIIGSTSFKNPSIAILPHLPLGKSYCSAFYTSEMHRFRMCVRATQGDVEITTSSIEIFVTPEIFHKSQMHLDLFVLYVYPTKAAVSAYQLVTPMKHTILSCCPPGHVNSHSTYTTPNYMLTACIFGSLDECSFWILYILFRRIRFLVPNKTSF